MGERSRPAGGGIWARSALVTMITRHRSLGLAVLGTALAAILIPTTAPAQTSDGLRRAVAPTAARAQAPKAKAKRPPTRIRVQPLYPYRRESLPYPTPYPVEYPGPGFVRECAARLIPENRPSGTVIVPHMRCWW